MRISDWSSDVCSSDLNYNYVRDGANQALNLLVGHLLARGMHVRVYSPTVAEPAFAPTGDLVDVPAMPLTRGRGEYRLAGGIPRRGRRHLDALAPHLVPVQAPDWPGPTACSFHPTPRPRPSRRPASLDNGCPAEW